MQSISLPFAEGVSVTCGLLMFVAGLLLWQHHPKRPHWGLRWLAVAMLLAAFSNLIAPFFLTASWRDASEQSTVNAAGFVVLMVGYGSLAALLIGVRDYVLQPLRRRWATFLLLWLLPQLLVILNVMFWQVMYVGDLLAAGFFLYCGWQCMLAARREPGVAHHFVALALFMQPLTLSTLLLLQMDVSVLRYLAAVPYFIVSFSFLSACLTRLHIEVDLQLKATMAAQQNAESSSQALKRSLTLQQAILDNAPVPIALTETFEGRGLGSNWNQDWYATFGYSREQADGVAGDAFAFYVEPELRQRYFKQLLQQGEVKPFEVAVRHANGNIMQCLMQGVVLNADSGRFAITSFRDISAQKAYEAHLKQYQAMVHNAADAMLVLANGILIFANPAAAKLFQMSVETLIGQSPIALSAAIQADGRSAEEAAASYIAQALAGVPQHFYWQHVQASGEGFTAHVSLMLIAGSAQQLVAVLRDVTEQKQAELALRQARQLSEVIAKAQLEFILQNQQSRAFDTLLNDILLLTESEYGFIGEVLTKPDGAPYLKTHAITNIAWSEETLAFYEQGRISGLEFTNLNSLFDQVMVTQDVVIANQPATDERRCGLPPGHPALNAFLGVPLFHGKEMIAMFGIANRPGGYNSSLVDFLSPLTTTIGQLMMAVRNNKKQLETEQRLNSLTDNIPNSMLYQINCGKDGQSRRITYLSEGIEKLHGLSTREVMHDPSLLYSQIHPDDLADLIRVEQACIDSSLPFSAEYRGLAPDGSLRWFYLSSSPSINSEGERVYDGIEIDITERKYMELALAEEREKLQGILDGTRAGTWDLNLVQDELEVNERWLEMLGYSRIELAPMNMQTWQSLVHPEDLAATLDILHQHLTGSTAFYTAEFRMLHKAGNWVWVQSSGKVISTQDDGSALVLRGTHLEITERKLAEQQLHDLNATLEARVKERTEALSSTLESLQQTQQELVQSEKLAALGSLVAGVAHELNTPIGNSVTVSSTLTEAQQHFLQQQQQGLTRTMLDKFVSNVGEAATMLMRNLERAATLVSSFKQVAVDQNNHQRREFALNHLLDEVQIVMTPGLRKAGVRLDIGREADLQLDSYPGALSQALMILIQNALTHAFDQQAERLIKITTQPLSAEWLEICVRDNGVGVMAANLQRIFDPFYTTKLGKGGSGLGLHICFNLVTATLGGRVSADSAPGQGLSITIALPLSAPAQLPLSDKPLSDE